ncbi:MAG TPA: HesA/MoeB/ThiF family protein [Steroidobacteraceae bacterium]|nr:HesA/MoeB/ThiF family protein [Steroidobacteraceae bacterium]
MTDRYVRQMVLPEVGPEGQARLAAATVLVAGAGGLGCPVLQYLCAAGVGRLLIVDHDRVDESNLHRQPLYRMSDLGAPKAQAAAAAMRVLNPQVEAEGTVERLTPLNVSGWVSRANVIVDAADSLALTYMLSDECLRQGKPLVSASVLGLSGYAGAFCGGAPSYRAVFPDMPRQAGSCAQSGVLGTAVGVMGTLQAHLTLALLLGLTPTVSGQLTSVDFRTLRFSGFSFASAPEPPGPTLRFIAPEEVRDADLVVDLRSLTEAPVSPFRAALRIGVEDIERRGLADTPAARIVLCCRSGIRAWRAAQSLRRAGHDDLALIAIGD